MFRVQEARAELELLQRRDRDRLYGLKEQGQLQNKRGDKKGTRRRKRKRRKKKRRRRKRRDNLAQQLGLAVSKEDEQEREEEGTSEEKEKEAKRNEKKDKNRGDDSFSKCQAEKGLPGLCKPLALCPGRTVADARESKCVLGKSEEQTVRTEETMQKNCIYHYFFCSPCTAPAVETASWRAVTAAGAG